jgi:hypothetical protein
MSDTRKVPRRHNGNDRCVFAPLARIHRVVCWLQKHWAPVGGIIAVLIPTVSLTFTIYKYWDETYIQPSNKPPHLNLSTKMEESAKNDALTSIKASIVVRNTSKQRVKVLSAWFNVAGSNIAATGEPADAKYVAQVSSMLAIDSDTLIARHAKVGRSRIVASGRLDIDWLDPDEEFSKTVLLYVPRDRYDLLQLLLEIDVVNLAKIRNDACHDRQDAMVSSVVLADGTCVVSQWRHDTAGAIGAVPAIKPRDSEVVALNTIIDRHHADLVKRYSISYARSWYELSLWPSSGH